mgnify:FL=1|jgi:polyphosphate kinase
MERNLLRRNESCFPILDESLRQQLKDDLALYLADNVYAWTLHGDGQYERLVPGDAPRVAAQEEFLERIAVPNQAVS